MNKVLKIETVVNTSEWYNIQRVLSIQKAVTQITIVDADIYISAVQRN